MPQTRCIIRVGPQSERTMTMDDKTGQDAAAKAQQGSAEADQAKPVKTLDQIDAERKAADAAKVDQQRARQDQHRADRPDLLRSPADRVLLATEPTNVHVVNATSPEAIAEQHRTVDENMAKLNEQNEPGHAKLVEGAQKAAEQAHENSRRHPPTGKQVNNTTPRIDEHGNKTW